MSDLENLYQEAVREDDLVIKPDQDDISEEFIREFAATALDASFERLSGKQTALVEKVMLHMICNRMIEWHSKIGVHLSEQGEHMAALGWLRDAGKFQSIVCLLETIGVSDEDFTHKIRD